MTCTGIKWTVYTVSRIAGKLLFAFLLFNRFAVYSGDDNSDDKLVKQYIQAKGINTIVFDSSNIKQYWIDHSVISQNNNIEIYMNPKKKDNRESIPYKIQLANVNPTHDCIIEVLTEESDVSFSVLNSKNKLLAESSSSSSEEKFLNYNVLSSPIHLLETDDLSFSLVFSSKKTEKITIKTIVLSIVTNSLFLNPKTFITKDNISTSNTIEAINPNSFSATGNNITIRGNDKIVLSDKSLCLSAKVLNAGDVPTKVYIGYIAYSEDGTMLKDFSYPYEGINNILTVISSEKGDNKIIVDQYSKWSKGCYLAVNVQEDMSDVPNNSFVNGRIAEVKQIEDNRAEIIMDKPLEEALSNGAKVRIHGISGGYLYTNRKDMNPGEEFVFVSIVKKDDNSLRYSPDAFPRGVSYVVPILLSRSTDSSKSDTIVVSDFAISY